MNNLGLRRNLGECAGKLTKSTKTMFTVDHGASMNVGTGIENFYKNDDYKACPFTKCVVRPSGKCSTATLAADPNFEKDLYAGKNVQI